MYMGADQDAVEVGASLGVAPATCRHLLAAARRGRRWAWRRARSAKLRAARISAPAAPMEAFTDAERASLAE